MRKGGPDTAPTGGDTCYLCAVDQDGNAVSLIQSVYFDFGSGIVAGDTGVLMQNRGAFFSMDEAHPNRLEPRKRTFHTLIPAMLMQEGQPAMVYGNMGGEGQPQSQAAVLTRVVDFGYDVQRAIEAPRWLYGRTWGTESAALSIEDDARGRGCPATRGNGPRRERSASLERQHGSRPGNSDRPRTRGAVGRGRPAQRRCSGRLVNATGAGNSCPPPDP